MCWHCWTSRQGCRPAPRLLGRPRLAARALVFTANPCISQSACAARGWVSDPPVVDHACGPTDRGGRHGLPRSAGVPIGRPYRPVTKPSHCMGWFHSRHLDGRAYQLSLSLPAHFGSRGAAPARPARPQRHLAIEQGFARHVEPAPLTRQGLLPRTALAMRPQITLRRRRRALPPSLARER